MLLHRSAEVSPEEIASHLEYEDETFIHQYICYNSSSIKLLGPSEESCIAECFEIKIYSLFLCSFVQV